MNISHILEILVPEYKQQTTPVINKKKDDSLDNIVLTKYDYDVSFDTFLKCILYSTKYNVEIEKERIIDTLMNYEFNSNINSKKVLLLINQNIVSNEVILFLSGFYEMNIYIYTTRSKIMRIYYIEDTLHKNKKSVLVFNCYDKPNNTYGYQTKQDGQLFTYNDCYIDNLIKSIYTIPIGLYENKILTLSDDLHEVDFIVGKIEHEENYVNENIIFNENSQIILEDDFDIDDFDIDDFDVDEFIKLYDTNVFMNDLHKIKSISV